MFPDQVPARRRSNSLRSEVSARGRALADSGLLHEQTSSLLPSIVFAEEAGGHGNFFPASWRRVQANSAWAARLNKTYTASARIPRSTDRWRGELECATSSDALLMNIFCHPTALRSAPLRSLLGIDLGARPDFGWRARVPLRDGYDDRTEIDMRLGDLLVEAKLCEGDFQNGRVELMHRYTLFQETFDIDRLQRWRGAYRSYQILRGVMAAIEHDARFCLMCDARRSDLISDWGAVLSAVQSSTVRCRLQLITWQEIATHLPRPLRHFLTQKYGIGQDGKIEDDDSYT